MLGSSRATTPLLAEARFGDAVRAIEDTSDRGGREVATQVVPNEPIDTVALANTPEATASRPIAARGSRYPS